MDQLKIKTNIVYDHLLISDKKIIVEQGGTRSGKTYNIILWIIFEYCTNNTNKVVTVCRKSFPSLRATVLRDFMSILESHKLYSEKFHNKSNSEYYLFGNLIEFISLDQPQKIRGRKRDLLFINEGNELYWEDWQQLVFRTQERIVIDFNPSDEYHWIYDKVLPRDDCDFFKTTYLDNPFVEESIKKEIELLKDTDEQYWQIYGLGERAASRSTVFRYAEVSHIPEDAELVAYGMDFGFSNDPSTLVSVYTKDINLYVKEHLYRTAMTTTDIHKFLLSEELSRKPIYADSAEPKSIADIQRYGKIIKGVTKGKDSINYGIDVMQRQSYMVTSKSTNLIKELRSYCWDKDKTGKQLNKPVDNYNHGLDAVRYHEMETLGMNKNYGSYSIL